MTAEFPKYRNPAEMFDKAIASGRLSTVESAPNFAGNYMYMGDADRGSAMFKHIETRAYLPAMAI